MSRAIVEARASCSLKPLVFLLLYAQRFPVNNRLILGRIGGKCTYCLSALLLFNKDIVAFLLTIDSQATLMNDHFPLSVLVTRAREHSQRSFATDALRQVKSDRVLAEVTDDGLLVRGMTELDLETVCLALAEVTSGLEFRDFRVEYMGHGSAMEEPYYLITVTVPEERMGNVMGDLSVRRGLITAVDDSSDGKTIKAEAPVAECMGYSTALRSLTRETAHVVFEFIGYRPCWPPRTGGDPVNVA